MTTNRNVIAIVFVALLASACASVPRDLGRSDVAALVTERGLAVDAGDTSSLLASLTQQPLTAENAIRIALVNNRELQATYAQLGFAAADVYASGRIRNPVISAAVLDSNRAGESDQITFGLVTSFTDLLTLSARKRLADAEFYAMKQTVGAAVLNTAADSEAAYYRYVAAEQVAALRAQIAKAGSLSAALAERYREAGNLTPRELALEHAAASETRLAALTAQADAYAARTELATVLSLPVSGDWHAPAALPVPLVDEDALEDLLALARRSRLDLAAAKSRADVMADRRGVADRTRWLGQLDAGAERERETDGARLTGPTVDWELPIFTQNRDALLRIDAQLAIAIAEVARLTLAVENDVYLAYAATENAKARFAEYRDRLVPARIAATARAQEEERFMLIGIFELLATKQQEYDAYQGYLEAVRDYWLARAELARAVGNTLPSSRHAGAERLDVDELIRPGADPHRNHGDSNTEKPEPSHGHHNGASR